MYRKCGADGGLLCCLILENITEIQVNNPTPGYGMKTECVLLGKCSGLLAELFYGLQSKQSHLTYHLKKVILRKGSFS